MKSDEVAFRLLRRDDIPATNPGPLPFLFGLQDTKGNLVAGRAGVNGTLSFDFCLTAKEGKDAKHPVFAGLFASGPS